MKGETLKRTEKQMKGQKRKETPEGEEQQQDAFRLRLKWLWNDCEMRVKSEWINMRFARTIDDECPKGVEQVSRVIGLQSSEVYQIRFELQQGSLHVVRRVAESWIGRENVPAGCLIKRRPPEWQKVDGNGSAWFVWKEENEKRRNYRTIWLQKKKYNNMPCPGSTQNKQPTSAHLGELGEDHASN